MSKYNKWTKTVSLVIWFLLIPINLFSFSLGRIETSSLQGEPLNADIMLNGVPSTAKLEQVKVSPPSLDDYWSLGLTIEDYHEKLEFSPYIGKDGKWYIKVTTEQPLSQNFVNFFVTVQSPKGSDSREYIAVLKKPIVATNAYTGPEIVKDEYYDFKLASESESTQIERVSQDNKVSYHDEYLTHVNDGDYEDRQYANTDTGINETEEFITVKKINNNVKYTLGNEPVNKTRMAAKNNTFTQVAATTTKPKVVKNIDIEQITKDITKEIVTQVKKELASFTKDAEAAKKAAEQIEIAKIAAAKEEFAKILEAVKNEVAKEEAEQNEAAAKEAEKIAAAKKEVTRIILAAAKKEATRIEAENAELAKKEAQKLAAVELAKKEAEQLAAVELAVKQQKQKSIRKQVVQFKTLNTNEFITRKGDTLWEIAKAFTKDNNNIQKMVMTIYVNNKSAFINNNVNLLKRNAKLTIPEESTVAKINRELAVKFLKDNSAAYALARSNSTIKARSVNRSRAIAANNRITKLKPLAKAAVTRNSAGGSHLSTAKQPVESSNATRDQQQNLRIVAENELDDSIASRLLMASEKIIVGQKENEALRQQIVMLQAQIRDIKKLLALNKVKEANNKLAARVNAKKSIKTNLANTDSGLSTSENTLLAKIDNANRKPVKTSNDLSTENKYASVDKSLFNPFSTIDIPVASDAAPSQTSNDSTISKASALDENTEVSNSPSVAKDSESVAAKNRFSAFLATSIDRLYGTGRTFVKGQSKMFLIFMILFTTVIIGAIFVYLYWRKHYRHDPSAISLATTATYSDEAILDDTSHTSSSSKYKDSFDIVKAYIELNDFVTARKLLNEIVKTGNIDQKTKAIKILNEITAA